MRGWLLERWSAVRSSYWFLPSLLTLLAMALAQTTLAIDLELTRRGERPPDWLYGGGPDGARALLSTVAASMIGVAGVTFSITIVTLSLASTQFGPRLLRNFMRDVGNQIVLGVFLAGFLYCLLALRAVRSEGDILVPAASVTTGVLLAVAGLGVLIYFIHHVSNSIQVDVVMAAVARELQRGLDGLPGREGGAVPQSPEPALPPDFDARARAVPATSCGYVQLVDETVLQAAARDCDGVVEMLCQAGDFVIEGGRLARAWSPNDCDDSLLRRIRQAFVLGSCRTEAQDVRYPLDQLVQVALRALSPGVNDPFTAITCVDWLGAALARTASRPPPSRLCCDGDGRLRLVRKLPDFAALADAALDPIRAAACGSALVSLRLLETLAAAAEQALPEARWVLLGHAERVRDGACADLPTASDRAALEERFRLMVVVSGEAHS